jgi:hypothetical protein
MSFFGPVLGLTASRNPASGAVLQPVKLATNKRSNARIAVYSHACEELQGIKSSRLPAPQFILLIPTHPSVEESDESCDK